MSTASGYDQSLFPVMAELERSSFWFSARGDLIAWAARRHFPSALSVLEIGCGTGLVLERLAATLPGLRLTGTDLFSEGLEFARQRIPSADLISQDATKLSYVEEFDLTAAFDVLEHIEDDEAVLAGLARATTPGGGLLVTVPQHSWLWGPMDELAHHVRRYSKPALVEKITNAGFKVELATSFVSLLLPLMFASRVRHRLRPASLDLARELVPGPRLNASLKRVMAAERACITRGARLPIGGSLLIAARKM
jgi:2-polyprenyl-3-methyl-5-hydroxy-6-metoxy-1,4-benzoquinol methylase